MKKTRLLPLLLAFAMLFSLSACTQADDPNLGYYACVRALSPDGTDSPEGAGLTLRAGENAELVLHETQALRWALDGRHFLLGQPDGEVYSGTLSNGVIEITIGETACIFVREGVSYTPPPVEPEPEPEGPSEEELAEQAAREEKAAYWSGSWYGWWFIREADGDYAELEGEWWDLCAQIEADAEGYAFMTLWDEDYSRKNPYGEAVLDLDFDRALHGEAVSVKGVFGPSVIGGGDWHLTPDAYEYDDLLVLSGTYSDDTGSYVYEGYLRPWGKLWDDVEEVSAELLPFYYQSWYLPHIDAGDEMPDVIGEGAELHHAA